MLEFKKIDGPPGPPKHIRLSEKKMADLIKLAVFAPSGTNSHACTFTCMASRSEVLAVGYPDETYQRITGRKKPTIRFC